MEQKQISCGSVCDDRLPPLSANYPWLVGQNLEAEDSIEEQVFYTLHDTCYYRCRIPELLGKRIRACLHGWVILSDHPYNVRWSLWNPVTSDIIRLPPLILKDIDSKSVGQCCLMYPPGDPRSTLLLVSATEPIFLFCRLDPRRKSWIKISHAKYVNKISGYGAKVDSLTCCDGKVFALSHSDPIYTYVIQFDIVVKVKKILIRVLRFGLCPCPCYYRCSRMTRFLTASSTELFYIILGFLEETKKTLAAVHLYKLDVTRIKWAEMEEDSLKTMDGIMWEEMEDLKDAVFVVDLARDKSVFYSRSIVSNVGGYVHIRGKMGKIIYSYHLKDNTISLSSIPSLLLPTSHVSMWECRLKGDHREAEGTNYSKQEEDKDDKIVVRSITDDELESNSMMNESHLLNIPFHMLEIIMEYCVGVEYMYFRATCKRCRLAAPLIQWSNKTALKKLHKYSVASPWLAVVDKRLSMITLTDPMFDDKYFMKKLPVSIVDDKICSGFGWLLFYSKINTVCHLVFLNPFTNDTRELPPAPHYLDRLCFSSPPTSPNCMVVGFTTTPDSLVCIHYVARESYWHRVRLYFGCVDPYTFCYPTFYDHYIYALCNEGELYAFKYLGGESYSWKQVVAKASRSCRSSPLFFLVKCDLHLLLVTMGDFGESIEVFKLNDFTRGWEKIAGLGRHMIYISDATCVCVKAKTHEMENKIYFSRLHSKNGKILFYSLETCKYHIFDGKNIQEHFGDFMGTTHHLSAHAWIEPSWS